MREKRDAKGRDYHSKVIRLYEKGVGNSIPTTKIFHEPPFSVWIEEKTYSMKISFSRFLLFGLEGVGNNYSKSGKKRSKAGISFIFYRKEC